MNQKEIEASLAGAEFFKGLDQTAIQKIAELCRVESYDRWEYIFRQGEPGENLYIIVAGQVLLERTINLGAKQSNVVISTLGAGQVCGCWSTLLNDAHVIMSSAACQIPTKVLAINGPTLRRVMTANPDFGFQILERLCFLLRDRIQSAFGAMEKI